MIANNHLDSQLHETTGATDCSYPGYFPELMTEEEVIRFLRIDEVSYAKDLSNTVYNLKDVRGLPRIYISNRPVYPKKAVLDWVEKETRYE